MSREQRWAASGVVVLLGALWLAVGLGALVEVYAAPPGDDMTGTVVGLVGLAIIGSSLTWLVAGLVAVRRVASGEWSWRPVAWCGALGALLSAVAVPVSRPLDVAWFSLLLGFQALALVAYAALLWTPAPVAGAGHPAA